METLKKQIQIKHLARVFILIIFSSCSYQPPNSDNFGNAGSTFGSPKKCLVPIGREIEEIMKSQSWKLTFFSKSGQDDTLKFKENTFQFSDLFLSPTDGIENIGSWRVTSNINKENYLLIDMIFVINLLNEYEVLDNNWSIDSYSKDKIELYFNNQETGENDYLTFETN